MKKLAFSLVAAVLFITACSKDDDKTTPAPVEVTNSFSFNDTSVVTRHAYMFDYGTDGVSFAFADTALVDTYTGKISAVGIDMESLESGHTYTYVSDTTAGYDKTKN